METMEALRLPVRYGVRWIRLFIFPFLLACGGPTTPTRPPMIFRDTLESRGANIYDITAVSSGNAQITVSWTGGGPDALTVAFSSSAAGPLLAESTSNGPFAAGLSVGVVPHTYSLEVDSFGFDSTYPIAYVLTVNLP